MEFALTAPAKGLMTPTKHTGRKSQNACKFADGSLDFNWRCLGREPPIFRFPIPFEVRASGSSTRNSGGQRNRQFRTWIFPDMDLGARACRSTMASLRSHRLLWRLHDVFKLCL